MKEMKQIAGEWMASWDFEKIEQEITELFPDLNNEILQEAMKMIPSKD